MDEMTIPAQKKPFLRPRTLIMMGGTVVAAGACFAVMAFLPPAPRSLFEDPLRSFLTGFGVIGVAYPLCAVGLAMRRRWASSPYFEGTFIATVMNLFGFLTVGVGLICIGFGVCSLVARLLGIR
jgi:hypothetical protein